MPKKTICHIALCPAVRHHPLPQVSPALPPFSPQLRFSDSAALRLPHLPCPPTPPPPQYDIIHCHDWQSAPIAWGDRGAAKAVFTIHNLSYGADLIGRAMQACSVATTVSPTYAREVC